MGWRSLGSGSSIPICIVELCTPMPAMQQKILVISCESILVISCEFEKLNTSDAAQTAEDDLLQMRLIDGLACQEHRLKILEHRQASHTPVLLGGCVELVQQLELIEAFKQASHENELEAPVAAVSYLDKNQAVEKKCKFCRWKHPRHKCAAFGTTCAACKKRNHFAKVCRAPNRYSQSMRDVQGASHAIEDGEISDKEAGSVFTLGGSDPTRIHPRRLRYQIR